MCCASMSTNPLKSPKNLERMILSNGLMFILLSSLPRRTPNSSHREGRQVSTSPTTFREKKIEIHLRGKRRKENVIVTPFT